MKFAAFTLLLMAGTLMSASRDEWDANRETDPVYGLRREEVFRRHRVKEVFIDEEAFYNGKLTTARHLNEYQRYDPTGRLIEQERAYDRVLTYRTEWEYNARGAVVAATSFSLIGTRRDTGRTDLAWLPTEHTRFVAEGTEQAGKTRWNANTGLWEPQTRTRTWTSHDTTYTETRNPQGNLTELERHFAIAKATQRVDYLTLSERGPGEPKFYYYRLEKGRTVESGEVTFEKELERYIEKHPEAMRYVLGSSKYGFHALIYHVAGHTAGTLKPTTTSIYNRQGQLLIETAYGSRTAYQRDAQGRAITSTQTHEESRGSSVTAYFYRPDGLLERETVTRSDGTNDENRCYRYRFY